MIRGLVVLSLVAALCGCSGDPRSFGITGPNPQHSIAPPAEEGPAFTAPGVTTSGSYGPTNGPSGGSSGYWGYN